MSLTFNTDPVPRHSGNVPRDRRRLTLRNYIREIEIGAFREEHEKTQRLQFDLIVDVQDIPSLQGDDVDNILSYDALVRAIDSSLKEGRLDLLETLADSVVSKMLSEDTVQRVELAIQKLDRGPFALGIEVVRHQTQTTPLISNNFIPTHRIVHAPNPFLAAPELARLIDGFVEDKVPTILTVDLPVQFEDAEFSSKARKQIALLAVDQNAWALADNDPRIAVVGTRTELEHRLASGLLSVWAPSKIVNRSFPELKDAPAPGRALNKWFSKYMNSQKFSQLSTS